MNKMSVLGLNEINSLMKLQLELQVKWMDPRMKFANLKAGEQRNVLSSEQKQKLWVPSLIFANNKKKMKAAFGTDSFGNIILNENAKYHQFPNKTRIFNGNHG